MEINGFTFQVDLLTNNRMLATEGPTRNFPKLSLPGKLVFPRYISLFFCCMFILGGDVEVI